jgi:hypothetical protein
MDDEMKKFIEDEMKKFVGEKKKEKRLDEYKQRHRDWRNIAVNQLSVTNNVLITLSTGLLVFCIKESGIRHIYIACGAPVDCRVLLFLIASIILGVSILLGIRVMFSRLYDFRISRHLALCRQRFYDRRELTVGECDLKGSAKKIKICKTPFIESDDIERIEKEKVYEKVQEEKNKELRTKYYELQKLSRKFGNSSWCLTEWELILFIISGIFYFLVWFIPPTEL